MNKEKIRKILYIMFVVIFVISIIYIISYFAISYKESNDIRELQDIMQTTTGKIINEEKELIKLKNSNNSDNIDNSNIQILHKNNDITNQKNISEKQSITNLKKLQKINSDIVAWIKIENTNIDYPILQGKDNDYYLKTNYKNEYSRSGSIFLDYRYDFNVQNLNFLVYGHNNNDGKMFNELLKYNQESYYKEHSEINIVTNKEDETYNIVAVFYSQVYNTSDTNKFKYYNYIELTNENDFYMYINNCKKESLYDIDFEATYGDKVLTLSTCEYSKENGRFVIVAIKKF